MFKEWGEPENPGHGHPPEFEGEFSTSSVSLPSTRVACRPDDTGLKSSYFLSQRVKKYGNYIYINMYCLNDPIYFHREVDKYGNHQAELGTAQKTPSGLHWAPALTCLQGLLSTWEPIHLPFSSIIPTSLRAASPKISVPGWCLFQDQVCWCKKGWSSSHFTHFGCKQAVTEEC